MLPYDLKGGPVLLVFFDNIPVLLVDSGSKGTAQIMQYFFNRYLSHNS
jgi:hypothetical protein